MKSGKAMVLCLTASVLIAGLAVGVRGADKEKGKTVLNVGDRAPSFVVHDDEGKIFNSADHVGKKVIVLFFFPAAMTGG